MGRRKTRWDSNSYGIYIIGEQLREQMHKQGQVKDRRYHLRKYKKCFIGRDAIDWILKMHHAPSRDEAVRAMQILQKSGVIHHVVDEHEFRDQHLFYRFTYDDNTYRLDKELSFFYRGVEIYNKMRSSTEGVMRDFYHKGMLYSEAFYGSDAVDFILISEADQERSLVVNEFRDLLERDIIKHVTDDYHFSDDRLIYEFNLDLNKPCLLQDVLDMTPIKKSSEGERTEAGDGDDRTSDSGHGIPVHIKSLAKFGHARPSIDSAMSGASSSTGGSSYREGDGFGVPSHGLEPKSVLIRTATVQELENPAAPYVKRSFRIESDEMGFGFVLRGSSPCYVQALDPLGPAASAGMKVRQFVSNVNGQNVLRMDHRQVGQMIAQQSKLAITVLMYRCDVDRL
ncbi:DEP domain-containing mTOR-interacting protein-like [Physella acuta]|uniref:DEP domain-containing mTOR-interacting protein-like n=1 Tax=Physella acuta TaxID=109671 RepID=UPI0027DD7E18|nr:DEP domain-containing mTOR-interacting protein-like [Physella acuta]